MHDLPSSGFLPYRNMQDPRTTTTVMMEAGSSLGPLRVTETKLFGFPARDDDEEGKELSREEKRQRKDQEGMGV
ncbi:unnamed protein product [Linum trigynum]|uniref:Uncharacterized protein n=1 Tax=Linum trigynum TaxID=586398 RepID=A0AAV2DSQ5_9ROSI